MDMLPKLIASDIDGTLLPPGETDIPTRIFPLLRRLTERGVLFCPASGRQYHSLRRLFAPVADDMCYLCENGSILFGPGPEETRCSRKPPSRGRRRWSWSAPFGTTPAASPWSPG